MKYILYTRIALCLFILFASCKRNILDPKFHGENQLIIGSDYSQNSAADSIIFSFAEYENTITEGEIILNASLMGEIADRDRDFRVEVVADSSTALPEEYELPSRLQIPAGAAVASFKIKVKRTARLVNTLAKVMLRVVPNENFAPGPRTPVVTNLGDQIGVITINYNSRFRFLWTDVLTKPPTWDAAGVLGSSYAFGIWSKVKHQLIIDASGVRGFSTMGAPEKFGIAAKAAKYLSEYNNAHPGNPLRSENGNVIGICNGCQ